MLLNGNLRRPPSFKSNEVWFKYWKKLAYFGDIISEYMYFSLQHDRAQDTFNEIGIYVEVVNEV